MATPGAQKRLTKEYMGLRKGPGLPYIIARPLEHNILEWHYVIHGPQDSPYTGGEYHGKVIFPADYPFKPPQIRMITPNGRFQTDTRLCLSMSDFHPGTWNPAWNCESILTGLLSFMLEDTPTTGSLRTTPAEKRLFAQKSHIFNINNRKFQEVFPELCTPEQNTSLFYLQAKTAATKNPTTPPTAPSPQSNGVSGHHPIPTQKQQQQEIADAVARFHQPNHTGHITIYQWIGVAVIILVAYIIGSRALNKIDL